MQTWSANFIYIQFCTHKAVVVALRTYMSVGLFGEVGGGRASKTGQEERAQRGRKTGRARKLSPQLFGRPANLEHTVKPAARDRLRVTCDTRDAPCVAGTSICWSLSDQQQ